MIIKRLDLKTIRWKIKKFVTRHRILELLLRNLLLISRDNKIVRLLRPWCVHYTKGSLRKITFCSKKIEVDLSDYSGWSLFYSSTVDSSLFVSKLAQKNWVVFDVGANIGQTAIPLSVKVGEIGAVYCFEPDKENFERLSRNIDLNPEIKNIHPYRMALGDGSEIRLKAIRGSPINSGSVYIEREYTDTSDSLVYIITLDEFVSQQKIKKLEMIKIDVEGYELKVLIGSTKTLSSFRPLIILEIDNKHLSRQGTNPIALKNCLEMMGYSLYQINHQAKLLPFYYEVSSDLHTDVLCFPREREDFFKSIINV